MINKTWDKNTLIIFPGYDTYLHLIVKDQFSRSDKYGETLYYPY